MRNILFYIRDFFFRVDKWLLLACALFAALLVVCNYTFHIETRWLYSLTPGWPRFLGFFALYAVAFIVPWLFLLARRVRRETSNAKRQTSAPSHVSRLTFDVSRLTSHDSGLPTPDFRLILLLLTAPAIFALKVSFPKPTVLWQLWLTEPWSSYYTVVSNLPFRLLLVALPLWLLWRIQRHESFWGLTTRNFQWKPYALMLLVMVPLIAFASTQPDFLRAYPKLRQVDFILPYIRHSWPYKLLFEISYGLDFVSIELFFRGFLVFAFVRYVGADAILPMAVFYCSIHFGKPLFECISSFFGGMLLGIVSYRTRSILGGFMVHVGIAWMMEIGGAIGHSLQQ